MAELLLPGYDFVGAPYLRKSTEDNAVSTATQRFYIEPFLAERRILAPPHLWFIDEEASGGKPFAKRKESGRLLRMAADRKTCPFTHVIIHRIDRLGREFIDYENILIQLDAYGITVLSVDDDMTDKSPDAILQRRVKQMFGEYHRTNTGVQVLKHNRKRHHESVHVGGRTPYGFKVAGRLVGEPADKPLEIDEAQSPGVVRLFELYVENCGNINRTAAMLNAEGIPSRQGYLWLAATVRDVISRPAYRQYESFEGNLRYKPEIYPTIVPADLLNSANSLLEARHGTWRNIGRKPSTLRSSSTYSGLLECTKCGYIMYLKPNREFCPCFNCNVPPGTPPEGQQRIQAATLDAAVVSTLTEALKSIKGVEDLSGKTVSRKVPDMAVRLRRLEQSRKRILDMYEGLHLGDAEFRERMDKANTEIAALKEPQSIEERSTVTSVEASVLLQTLGSHWGPMGWNSMDNRSLLLTGFGIGPRGIRVTVTRSARFKSKDVVTRVEIDAPKLSDEPLVGEYEGTKRNWKE